MKEEAEAQKTQPTKRGRPKTRCGCQKEFPDGSFHCQPCRRRWAGCPTPDGCLHCQGEGVREEGVDEVTWQEASGNDAPKKMPAVEAAEEPTSLEATSFTTEKRSARADAHALTLEMLEAPSAVERDSRSHKKKTTVTPVLRSEAALNDELVRLTGLKGAHIREANTAHGSRRSRISHLNKAIVAQDSITDITQQLNNYRTKAKVREVATSLKAKVNDFITRHEATLDGLKEEFAEYNKYMNAQLKATRKGEKDKYELQELQMRQRLNDRVKALNTGALRQELAESQQQLQGAQADLEETKSSYLSQLDGLQEECDRHLQELKDCPCANQEATHLPAERWQAEAEVYSP
jgi:hypothetical protein